MQARAEQKLQEGYAAANDSAAVDRAVVSLIRPLDVALASGGPEDLWDIRQLLDRDQSNELQGLVSAALENLPVDFGRTWSKVVDGPQ